MEDISEVAAKALSEDGHIGQVYELTGPRLLTFEEALGEIAAATGRGIRYVPVSMEGSRPGRGSRAFPTTSWSS